LHSRGRFVLAQEALRMAAPQIWAGTAVLLVAICAAAVGQSPPSLSTMPSAIVPVSREEGKKNPDEDKNPDDKEKKNGEGKENGDKDKDKEKEAPTWYSVHGQGTVVGQGNWLFHSPYQGPNSFLSRRITARRRRRRCTSPGGFGAAAKSFSTRKWRGASA
jgi:hypothetical protein